MNLKYTINRFWSFLKEDNWQSWLVSIILVVIIIKFIFFPILSLVTGSPLPLVVVESCSMYHDSSFNDWWSKNSALYEKENITKEKFSSFSLKNGFNKGDIVFIWGYSKYKRGDIITFNTNKEATARYPIIHRIISINPIGTKGDNNQIQFSLNLPSDVNPQRIDESSISEDRILGKALFKIPLLGWIKLIFFEPLRNSNSRGFCK